LAFGAVGLAKAASYGAVCDRVREGKVEIVDNFYARCVFFVKDAERSLRFYTETLGFSLEWNHQEQGRAFVFNVSLLGFQLILNQTEPGTEDRAGHGRVFIGLDDDQVNAFRKHIEEKGIKTTVLQWGDPTLVVLDLDGNELFFWPPESERAILRAQLGSA
jgi:catechol 2,3-dioxygenase-like lactoylglutathione lyase family enzyme